MSKMVAAMIAMALTGAQPAYKLDPASSSVTAKVGFLGLASKTAGFPAISGSIRIDAEDTASVDLRVDLDARALTAPDQTTLKRLKGEKFFWVERYPTVSFRGDTLLMETDRKGRVEGRMTARGVTRPVMLDVTFDRPLDQLGGNRPIVIEAETTIDRRDFGMKSYSMVVGKKVDIRIRARLLPQSG